MIATVFAAVVPSKLELKKQVKHALGKKASIDAIEVSHKASVYTVTGTATIAKIKNTFQAIYDCSTTECVNTDMQVAEVPKKKNLNAVTTNYGYNMHTLTFTQTAGMTVYVNGKQVSGPTAQVTRNDMVVVQQSGERAIPVKSVYLDCGNGRCQTISPIWRCTAGFFSPSAVSSTLYNSWNLAFNLNLVNSAGEHSIWVRNIRDGKL